MALGTGSEGCYPTTLDYKSGSPDGIAQVRLHNGNGGAGEHSIKVNRMQGPHVSSIGTDEHYNLIPYFTKLAEHQIENGGIILEPIIITDNDQNTTRLNILEIIIGSFSITLKVEGMGGSTPDLALIGEGLGEICIPPIGALLDDEPSQGGHGENDSDEYVDPTVRDENLYTISHKALQDTTPPDPMVYDGEPVVITLDLRNIVYKRSALNEILPNEFKSY